MIALCQLPSLVAATDRTPPRAILFALGLVLIVGGYGALDAKTRGYLRGPLRIAGVAATLALAWLVWRPR